ncbi:13749_t:CDS:2, partial [Acaulospora colombiana]
LRPVPLSSTLEEMSINQLAEAVFRAVKITSLLEKKSIAASQGSMIFYAIESHEPGASFEETVENDIQNGGSEKSILVERCTVGTIELTPQELQEITLRSERKLPGTCRSNFTRRTLAGCLLTDRNQEQLYFIDWEKGTEGIFTVSFPGEAKEDVFIYTEDTLNAFYYTFPLREIAERLTPSISSHIIAPATVQVLYHNPDDTRNVGWTLPQIVTFSLMDIFTGTPEEDKGNIMDYAADTGYVVAPAQRLIMKALPDPGLAESVGGWDLWTVGGSAKGAAWLQQTTFEGIEDPDASFVE